MPRTLLIVKASLATLLLVTSFFAKKEEAIGVPIYGAPYIIALLLPSRYTAFAVGLSLGAIFVELPFSIFFSFFGGLFPDPIGLLAVRILAILLFSAGIACLAAYHRSVEHTDRSKTLSAGLLSVTYIALITVAATAATRQTAGVQVNATEILGQIDSCLLDFAQRHEATYPATLSEIGPDGSRCLDANLASGRSKGIKIEYTPDTINRRDHYHVILRADTWFNANEKSFYSDESGVIHESYGGHMASSRDRVVRNPTPVLRLIAQCLIDMTKDSGGAYPRSIEQFPKDPSSACSREFMTGGLEHQSYGARIAYAPKVLQGRITGFVLEARPQVYGKNGIRSYFADETGIVRGTPEDRPARSTDPPVPSCEYDFNPCSAL